MFFKFLIDHFLQTFKHLLKFKKKNEKFCNFIKVFENVCPNKTVASVPKISALLFDLLLRNFVYLSMCFEHFDLNIEGTTALLEWSFLGVFGGKFWDYFGAESSSESHGHNFELLGLSKLVKQR